MNNFLAKSLQQKLQSSRDFQQFSLQNAKIASKNAQTPLKNAQNPLKNAENTTDSLKNKVRLQIERRFNESQPNKTYVFPRKRAFSKHSRDFSNDSSLESIKAVFLYDLRQQNKENREKPQNFKAKAEKFIKGKYQILKGKSLLHKENSYNSLESSQGTLRKTKNFNGSADLRENLRKPIHFNPLYQLTKNNIAGKRRIFKGLSTNFGTLGENLKKIRSFNQFSSTFLEINPLKINLPEIKSTNSFKLAGKK